MIPFKTMRVHVIDGNPMRGMVSLMGIMNETSSPCTRAKLQGPLWLNLDVTLLHQLD